MLEAPNVSASRSWPVTEDYRPKVKAMLPKPFVSYIIPCSFRAGSPLGDKVQLTASCRQLAPVDLQCNCLLSLVVSQELVVEILVASWILINAINRHIIPLKCRTYLIKLPHFKAYMLAPLNLISKWLIVTHSLRELRLSEREESVPNGR